MQHWSSFRDPTSTVEVLPGSVVRRFGDAAAAAEVRDFYRTDKAKAWIASGRLIGLADAAATPEGNLPGLDSGGEADPGVTMIHPRVAFPSFPYEWPASMLHAAAALTIELAAGALDEGYELKDASPFNVLFEGSAPVFIDAASFRRRSQGRWLWPALAQFERSFLLPLLAHRLYGDEPHALFRSDSDGMSPEMLASRVRGLDRLKPKVLRYATLPGLLGRFAKKRSGIYQAEHRPIAEDRALFVLRALFSRLKRDVAALAPRQPRRDSAWSGYAEDRPYTDEAFVRKEAFVRDVVDKTRPGRVIDIGCNDGHFGRLAARAGARVVAFDRDAQVVDALWRAVAGGKPDLLPLVIDLSRPSAREGWRNAERPGFLDRAIGQFDAALFLACFHHVIVTDRIPVPRLLDFLVDLGCRDTVFEYVDPADAMFRTLLRGRAGLHEELNQAVFEQELRKRFAIAHSIGVTATRRLYWLTRP